MKRFLVTEIPGNRRDIYGRPLPDVSREELPPNARMLTREQVLVWMRENRYRLAVGEARGDYNRALDELFGGDDE